MCIKIRIDTISPVNGGVKMLLMQKRKEAGLRRKDLVKLLGISYSMIEKVEKGRRTASPGLAKKWGDLIGVSERELYRYFFTQQADKKSGNANPNSAA